jgi:hypothetical protein
LARKLPFSPTRTASIFSLAISAKTRRKCGSSTTAISFVATAPFERPSSAAEPTRATILPAAGAASFRICTRRATMPGPPSTVTPVRLPRAAQGS